MRDIQWHKRHTCIHLSLYMIYYILQLINWLHSIPILSVEDYIYNIIILHSFREICILTINVMINPTILLWDIEIKETVIRKLEQWTHSGWHDRIRGISPTKIYQYKQKEVLSNRKSSWKSCPDLNVTVLFVFLLYQMFSVSLKNYHIVINLEKK